MHEILPYSAPNKGGINRTTLLRKIWTEPQATLTYLVANSIDEHVSLLFVLGGIARAVSRAAAGAPSKTGASAALLFAVIGGSISGIITYTAYSWAMSLVGGWLGGKASTYQFKIVLSWALIPTIATLLFSVPILYLFDGASVSNSLLTDALLTGCSLAQLGLSIWAVIILIKGVMIIQRFEVGRALANMVLPGVAVVGVIVLIASFW